MPLIDKKYDQLFLNDDYLTDPILMALAWKKAHNYIRTTNWYADNFELDKSSLNLAQHCKEWVEEIRNGKLKLSELELVPAPKTSEWVFTKEPRLYENEDFGETPDLEHYPVWKPCDSTDLKLRPLAHIGIKEQSLMTLIMMCLANDVETAQGDPSTAYEDVHDKGIVSYGNRLYCKYTDDKAEHSFGATTVFSKFFTDYRTFLNRPYHFAAQEKKEISPDEEIYLVELDLSKFFDKIDRPRLIDKIQEIATTQDSSRGYKRTLTNLLLNAFKDWKWSKSAIQKWNHLSKNSTPPPPIPHGLPQGLVASGFLANIYMLDFDDLLKNLIGETISKTENIEPHIKIIDYCRYVDDMRLVVVGPDRTKLGLDPCQAIKECVEQIVEHALEDSSLVLNKEKTNVEVYRGKSAGISKTLQDIQSKGSGPMSMEDMDEQITQLESLLLLTSTNSRTVTKSDESELLQLICTPNYLANIEKGVFDVREDTLKRFAANKISKKLSEMRHFTSRETDDNGDAKPGKWDYLQERIARKLLACWSHDPSLVLLLKKSLELFPSTKILNPILQQVRHIKRIAGEASDEHTARQEAVIDYCLSEIFRHSAFVIHRKDPQAFPAHANIEEYFEVLQDYAAKLLGDQQKNGTSRPEFNLLLGQARFLLLTRLDTLLEHDSGDAEQDLIFKLAKGFRNIQLSKFPFAPKKFKLSSLRKPEQISGIKIGKTFDSSSISTCILIASQLITDRKPLLRSTWALLNRESSETAQKVLSNMAVQDPEFVKSLIFYARPLKTWWARPENDLVQKLYTDIAPSEKPLGKITGATSIYKLISRSDNPFANETMALKLLEALLSDKSEEDIEKLKNLVIDLGETKVKANNGYAAIPRFESFDESITVTVKTQKPLQSFANHLHFSERQGEDPQKRKTRLEAHYLQRVALCVRSALSGAADPTGFGISHQPRTGYRGLKSTQYKRQLGMMTTPESLAGEGAQCSAWLTTLLAKLLRWPGIHVNDQGFEWPIELSIENVKKLVNERLAYLKQNYCQLSGMPGLPELIKPDWHKEKKSLTVAMVQSKMPFKNDFGKHGLTLDDPEYRTKHRRHVARVAQLVLKHIEAQHVDKPKEGKREQDIDLIIWPELAVHKDDIGILKQLSQKTHAIILAGLGFLKQPNGKDLRNCALWIVPKKHNGNQNEVLRLQGKHNMMADEKGYVQPWRPYQLMLELKHPKFPQEKGFILTGAICYDSTDINLSADLRDKSNAFLIAALNRDVSTFDTMVDALHYHMHQPVVLVNTGEFGGSYAKAPYKENHRRLIAHSSGNNQVSINTFEMNMFDFRRDGVGKSMRSDAEPKTPPAGVEYT